MTSSDLAALGSLGLDPAKALRAMAQAMAWVVSVNDEICGAATAHLADGTVFLDQLVGPGVARQTLIDHALAYARWSDAPALTLRATKDDDALTALGFVGLDPDRLSPELHRAAEGATLLMRRL